MFQMIIHKFDWRPIHCSLQLTNVQTGRLQVPSNYTSKLFCTQNPSEGEIKCLSTLHTSTASVKLTFSATVQWRFADERNVGWILRRRL